MSHLAKHVCELRPTEFKRPTTTTPLLLDEIKQAALLIKAAMKQEEMSSFLAWTKSTPDARQLTAEFVELNNRTFPALVAELRATAHGE